MASRSQRSAKERNARSRAVRRVADEPLLRGSLVVMRRTCGKQGCHCQTGEKHSSLYLAVRREKRRTMIYVPPALEETVRAWVENGRQVDELLDFVAQQCLEQLLEHKEQVLGRTPGGADRKRSPKERPP
ncbi:MAG TPA: DUF6788 family protein [Terriglobales bacterium]|nr:DUF6788 family protein [Terriglobales bacterium]